MPFTDRSVMRQSRWVGHAAVLCMPLLAACGSARAARPPAGATGSLVVPAVRVYDNRAARWTDFEEMTRTAAQADLIFLGEQHDDPVTHSVELAVLRAIGAQRGRVVLSLEMFERDVQPLLDRYLAGSGTEAEFLAASRPWDRYATDYRPLVELAKARGWPVIAANVPRRIAGDVSRRGLAHLDTITAADRAFIAREHSCPRDRYFQRFVETMGSHGAGGGPPSAASAAAAGTIMERFYQAQCVKDEAMGEAVADAFLRTRPTPVLHVDGAFHSDYALGTVERARRRAPDAKVLVLTAVPTLNLNGADPAPHKDRADYLVFTLAAPPKR
jgi:uncharacterized iron-regulated protein